MTPPRPRQQRAVATRDRWARWQQTPVAQKYLPHDARAMGYTVARIPPQARDAFLDLLRLLIAYAHLARRRQMPEEARAAWRAWQTWTRGMAAYLERLTEGHQGTKPPVPDALVRLVDGQEEADG
jgi:hypothetical protein